LPKFDPSPRRNAIDVSLDVTKIGARYQVMDNITQGMHAKISLW